MRIRVKVYRAVQGEDDPVGGANILNVLVYDGLHVGITRTSRPQNEDVVALETKSSITMTFRAKERGNSIVIENRDFIEVVWPANNPLIGKLLRVTDLNQSLSERPERAVHKATLELIEQDRKTYEVQ